MGMNQPTPEQMAMMQEQQGMEQMGSQTSDLGIPSGDPTSMQNQQLEQGYQQPWANQDVPQEPPVTAQVVVEGLFKYMMELTARGISNEVNANIIAPALSQLSAAYKNLTEQGSNPQLEEAKVQSEIQDRRQQQEFDMELQVREFALKQQQAEQDMQLKREQAAIDAQLKQEQHQQKLALEIQNQQAQQELQKQSLSSQHAIGMTKAKQGPKAGTSDSSKK